MQSIASEKSRMPVGHGWCESLPTIVKHVLVPVLNPMFNMMCLQLSCLQNIKWNVNSCCCYDWVLLLWLLRVDCVLLLWLRVIVMTAWHSSLQITSIITNHVPAPNDSVNLAFQMEMTPCKNVCPKVETPKQRPFTTHTWTQNSIYHLHLTLPKKTSTTPSHLCIMTSHPYSLRLTTQPSIHPASQAIEHQQHPLQHQQVEWNV